MKRALIAVRDSLAKIIQNRTGKTKAEVKEIMENETWLSATKAKKEGFIDVVVSTKRNKESTDITNKFENRLTEKTLKKVGAKWEITIIEAGRSNNRFYYSDEVLKEAAPLFEGIKVFTHQFGDRVGHRPDELRNPYVLVSNEAGVINNVRFTSSDGKGKLQGYFHCVNSALADILANTWRLIENGELREEDMLGFSVDVGGKGYVSGGIGIVTKIGLVNSVDIVTGPSAGGRFERMVASYNKLTEEEMDEFLKKILEAIKNGTLTFKGSEGKSDEEMLKMVKDVLGFTEDKKESITAEMMKKLLALPNLDEIKVEMIKMIEANKEPAKEPAKEPQKVPDPLKAQVDKLQTQIKIQESTVIMNDVMLKENTLDEVSKARIRKMYEGKVFNRDEIEGTIKEEKSYLDRILESGQIKGMGSFQVGDTSGDKMQKALDLLVDPELKRITESAEEYKNIVEFTGLQDALKQMCNIDVKRVVLDPRSLWNIKEATTSDFPIALGDSMNKRIIREYKKFNARAMWQKLVTEESVSNLNEQTLSRFGGFGEIPIVAEDGTFQPLTTPSEDNPTYTPTKRGGTFTLTEEMMINDNLRSLRQFPKEMARAAVFTLSKFVFGLITGCDASDNLNTQTIFDGDNLYSNAHNNITADVLNFANFDNAFNTMAEKEQADSEQPIVAEPKWLLVPSKLRRTAWDITVNDLTQSNLGGTDVAVQNAISQYGVAPMVIPSQFLCFSTNVWILISDPQDIEGLVIGYLNNKREPEILLQDQPTVAGVFTNDRITYRVKFRFGGTITDFRGFHAGSPDF